MLADNGVVLGPDAQADVLVDDARHHRRQHRRVVDMLGVGRDRAGQRLLLLAARLVPLVEDVLEFRIVLEHAGVEMARQGLAMGFQDGGRGLDQDADLRAQH